MEDFTFIPVLAETMTSSLSDFNIIQIIGFIWNTWTDLFSWCGCWDAAPFPIFTLECMLLEKGIL